MGRVFYSSWLGKFRRLLMLFFVATALPVTALRWWPPPTTAFMVRSQVLAWWDSRSDYRLDYRWVDFGRISRSAQLAVIASEDQRFGRHVGFDFDAISRAMASNQRGRPLRGASTITQQTAKNLFLLPSKNLWRKALEAYFTLLLEVFCSKQRILEIYLNVAEFGEGIFGVEAASRHYFGKSAAHLSAREAATLAASLPNPAVLNPGHPSAYMLKRRNWILEQMRRLGPHQIG